MEIFSLTAKQMLTMFTLILAGFILKKKSIVPDDAQTTMSRVLLYIFTPGLSLYTQMNRCTVETFKENYVLLLYGFLLALGAVLLSYPLSRAFIKNFKSSSKLLYQRNIYKYALAFGNISFLGNFLVLGVWGQEMLFKYQLFSLFPVIACNVWGLYQMIPNEQNIGILLSLKKGLINPPVISLFFGIIMGLTGLAKYVPDFLMTAFNNAGSCQGPVAMVLAGFVIGGYSLKELVKNKKVYVASVFRLILIPSAMMLILKALGTSEEILIFVLVAFAAPLGLNTIVYPAAYGGDTKIGASMATISNVLAIASLPLMYLVFVVLL